ncbi:MAG TPA: NUDIX hydrolase, partial [Casimicrobiaceae bacterium]|nr:NUDIX hydrolase [Casimicrobiaceae bacterium]
WEAVEHDATFVRMAFAATPRKHHASRPLDDGIVRAVWLTYEQIAESRARHRSPLVLRCVEDYRRGRRLPLDALIEVQSDG